MQRTFAAVILFITLFAFHAFVPQSAQAVGLTQIQTQIVIDLLKRFGASEQLIDQVAAILRGTEATENVQAERPRIDARNIVPVRRQNTVQTSVGSSSDICTLRYRQVHGKVALTFPTPERHGAATKDECKLSCDLYGATIAKNAGTKIICNWQGEAIAQYYPAVTEVDSQQSPINMSNTSFCSLRYLSYNGKVAKGFRSPEENGPSNENSCNSACDLYGPTIAKNSGKDIVCVWQGKEIDRYQSNAAGASSAYTTGSSQCPRILGNLYLGARGTAVSQLQRFLQQTGDYTYPQITGYYGTLTRQAVERFQCRELGLCAGSPYTNGYGVVGPKTRAAIKKRCGAATLQTAASAISSDSLVCAIPPQCDNAQLSPEQQPAFCRTGQTVSQHTYEQWFGQWAAKGKGEGKPVLLYRTACKRNAEAEEPRPCASYSVKECPLTRCQLRKYDSGAGMALGCFDKKDQNTQ